VILLLVAVVGWTYYRSLVPAIHEDHDHGLENLAGGGFLNVEAVEGGHRNLVGRPDRLLILHWFELGMPATAGELPLLVDYAQSVAHDRGIEVVLVVTGTPRETVLQWARDHGVPTRGLYVDRDRKTAGLIGAQRIPETLIYDPQGHLVHQARGPMNWSDPQVRAAIEGFKQGGGEHRH
jgi:hypothetical protein